MRPSRNEAQKFKVVDSKPGLVSPSEVMVNGHWLVTVSTTSVDQKSDAQIMTVLADITMVWTDGA